MGLMSGDDRLWVNVNCGQSVLRRAEKLREIKAPLQFEEQQISHKTSYMREKEKIIQLLVLNVQKQRRKFFKVY